VATQTAFLAIDLGAESGRAVLGRFDGERITLEEAHRFANTYHQLLMKKRIGESILDDCPGVSENRKALLLKRFGSVERLRKAPVEEVAGTEGIGPRLAEQVLQFLAERQ